MSNAFATELYKTKHNKMAFIGFLCVVSIPILLFLKSIFLDGSALPYQEWVQTCLMLVGIMLPVMSGLFITQSVQKEYSEKTIINLLTAPTKRDAFVFSKIGAWFCWYMTVLLATVALTFVASALLYAPELTGTAVIKLVVLFLQTNFFSFLAFLPVFCVAVKQRASFFPSVLTALLFTLLQSVGSQVSTEFLPLASFVPWLAVSITGQLP